MSYSTAQSTLPRWKRLTFSLISVLLGLLFSLAAAELILRYVRHHIEHSDKLEAGMMLYDKQLGWRLAPGWEGSHQHYDFNTYYQINHMGFRGTLRTENNRQSEAKHIAIVGDSFTFGTGVKISDTFTTQLNSLGEPGIIFRNYGVPGYSTDQEYLLIKREIKPLKPNHIILVVYLGNDLFDNQLAFPLQAENSKPFFSLNSTGQLKENNLPVPTRIKPAALKNYTLQNIVMGEQSNDYSLLEKTLGKLELFRRLGLFQYHPNISDIFFDQRFNDSLQLFYALVSAIKTNTQEIKAGFSIALLPGRSAIVRPASVSAQYQSYLSKKIVKHLSMHPDIQIIDLYAALSKAHNEQDANLYFPNEGHLTPSGHRVVANKIIKKLKK